MQIFTFLLGGNFENSVQPSIISAQKISSRLVNCWSSSFIIMHMILSKSVDLSQYAFSSMNPAEVYNRNTRTMYEIRSKLKIKTLLLILNIFHTLL